MNPWAASIPGGAHDLEHELADYSNNRHPLVPRTGAANQSGLVILQGGVDLGAEIRVQ